MTIDELCQVIRQRRKRTGLTWSVGGGVYNEWLREDSVPECCPMTAAWCEIGGDALDPCEWEIAAKKLGVDGASAMLIVDAADNMPEQLDDNECAVREKLIAACTGPLD